MRMKLAPWFIVCMVLSWTATAESLAYEEGTHYVELPIPRNTGAPNSIVVTEYFSYGCPHCYQFDSMLMDWYETKPEGVVFRRSPAVWNRDYKVYAQAFYAAEAFGIVERIHRPMFEAIHVKGRSLNDPQALAVFFAEFGIEPKDFAKVFNSFGVNASVQQAGARGRAFRATGVPAMIVNGKYRVEGSMAGSNAEMLNVVNFLIEKEKAAKSKSNS